MSKLYIFITTSLKVAGGNQCYTAAKARFLEENGWKTLVFFQGDRVRENKCLIDYFNKFLDCDITGLSNPPFKYPGWLRNKILSRMLALIGDYASYTQIIIESHEDAYAQWAELLASRIHAKHFFYLMNERFRGPDMYYEQKIDFYRFKYDRREIIGGKRVISRLFDGYDYVVYDDLPDYVEIDEAPIQNVASEKVDAIVRCDWNICYIGRGVKPYVPNIIRDAGRLAGAYPERTVQLLFVSMVDVHRGLIDEMLGQYKNLKIVELGFLHPIPQSLFDKVDVVIAGSGSARHSAESGALVLVADPETNKSDGLLGYETMSTVYQEQDAVVSDFFDALVRVLVDQVHLTMPNRYPPGKGVRETVLKQFELYDKSSREIQYYDETALVAGKRDWRVSFIVFMRNYLPGLTGFLKKLCLLVLAFGMFSGCNRADILSEIDDRLWDDASLPCLAEERSPDLNIHEGLLSTQSDTVRIVRDGAGVAIVVIDAPKIVAQATEEEPWGFFQFPQVYRSEDGSIKLTWSMRADSYKAYGDLDGCGFLESRDEGLTWVVPTGDFFRKDAYRADLRNGDILQVYTPEAEEIANYADFPAPVNGTTVNGYNFYDETSLPETLRGVWFDLWSHRTKEVQRFHATLDDPGLLRYSLDGFMPIVWWGHVREKQDGTLVTGVEGCYYTGDNGMVMRSSVAFYESKDVGRSWTGLGKIHYRDAEHDSYAFDGSDGFTEPAFEILDDGTYLCVMRSGSASPMYKAFSYDNGIHWTVPEAFTPNGVRPNMLVLDNGVLVLASGRPGIQLRFCLDGCGEVWTSSMEMMPYMDKNGRYSLWTTCGYTSLLKTGSDSFMIVYSDFATTNDKGESRKSILMRKVKVVTR